MGVGIYIKLQRTIEGADPLAIDGKAVSRNLEQLDRIASAQGWQPIGKFLSFDASELAEFAEGEGLSASEIHVADEKWFSADSALSTVSGLVTELSSETSPITHRDDILRDLQQMKAVLQQAAAASVLFHFTMDMP